MTDFSYAGTDDFQKAAARILKYANDGIKDAQSRLASKWFFRRSKLLAKMAPSMELLLRLLKPAKDQGTAIVKTPEAAEAYCRGVSDIVMNVMKEMGPVTDADADAQRLMLTVVSGMMQTTAGVLTKKTHDECWHGGEGFEDEIRAVFQT